MTSTIIGIVCIAITLCFALGFGVAIVNDNNSSTSGILFGVGTFLLILLVGVLISIGVAQFFQGMNPPTNTITVTITPEPR